MYKVISLLAISAIFASCNKTYQCQVTQINGNSITTSMHEFTGTKKQKKEHEEAGSKQQYITSGSTTYNIQTITKCD